MDVGEAAGAVTAIATVVAAAYRFVLKPIRDGRARRIERAARIDRMVDSIEAIRKQVYPNGGTSIFDKLDKLWVKVRLMDQRNELAWAALAMGTFRSDGEGDWTSVNQAVERQTGRTDQELLGRGWFSAIAEDQRESIVREWMRAVDDERDVDMVFSWTHSDPGHKPVPVRMRAKPSRDDLGVAQGHVGFIQPLDVATWPPVQ